MQTSSNQSSLKLRIFKQGFTVVLVVLLSACWAYSIKPPVAEIDKLGTVLIVPVESPPLEIIPDPIEQRIPAYAHYRNMAVEYSSPTKIYQTSGGVTIAGRVSAPDDEQDLVIVDERATPSLMIGTGTEQTWTPTLVLARQAMTQLGASNVKAVMSRDYYRLPMADADRNAGLNYWHDAIVKWYGQDAVEADYKPYAGVDAVLELGLGSYRIFEGQTSIQVLMKLINPKTGQVIARTHARDFTVKEAGQAWIHRDSEPFKQLVSEMSSQLLKQGLNDIGWRL